MNNNEWVDDKEIIKEKIIKITGETEIVKYLKGTFLGRGGFAKCYIFQNLSTNKITAAKIIAKSSLGKSREKQKLINEIKIHKALHHNNIVHFEHYFEDNDNVFLLLELGSNKSPNELLKRRKVLTELEVQVYVLQIIKALKYLHNHRIIHRDLKLSNLFLSENMELKIGDFGLATKLDFEGEKKRTVCGTPNYIAPEILDGKFGYSFEVDIWSLGVIIYTLIIGKPPFETDNVKETYKKIKLNKYSFPINSVISDYAKNLITDILVTDPSKRPTLDDILESDFFYMGISLPKTLNVSTLSVPPTLDYIKQYIPNIGENGIVNKVASNFKYKKHFNLTCMSPEGTARLLDDKDIENNNNNVNPSDVYVVKWVDYSSKYGLGYLLSNHNVGIFFNDLSKIVYNPKGTNFLFVERNPNNRIELITPHFFNEDFNKELNKKVTLLNHFKKYLLEEENENIQTNEKYNINEKNYVYVKKWMRTKQAILFRLSNKIIQVCFLDTTEIILKSDAKQITYINKKNERKNYSYNSALESEDHEMNKRLKYTKEMLAHILSKSNN
jgi:polo-like kinase 1